MKSLFPLSVAVAVTSSTALANPLSYANETGGEITFYGQVSPTFLSVNDGDETDSNIVDNSHSNSRVGFNLDQDFGNGTELRFKFETALALPGSGSFTQDDDDNPVWDWEETDLRKVEFIYSGGFGALSFGQGSMATDGVATNDLSKTTMASTVATGDTAGGYFFRQFDGDLSGIELGDAYDDFDGSRKGRIRYDTPDFNGFSFAVAVGQDVLGDPNDRTYYDVAALYEGKVGDLELAGGIGFASVEEDDEDTVESWAGSIAALHEPTGLNAALSFGSEVDGGQYTYAKLGWIADLLSAGDTAFSVDYYSGTDFVSNGSESGQWGVQAAQHFDDFNLEAYLGYAEYAFDAEGGANLRIANSVIAGLRWKF